MQKKTLSIDTVDGNVVNRVSAGSSVSGTLRYEGGVLIQGDVFAKTMHVINGPLILAPGAKLTGEVIVDGDVFICGFAGVSTSATECIQLKALGVVHIAGTGRLYGSAEALDFALYKGSRIHGPMVSTGSSEDAPVA